MRYVLPVREVNTSRCLQCTSVIYIPYPVTKCDTGSVVARAVTAPHYNFPLYHVLKTLKIFNVSAPVLYTSELEVAVAGGYQQVTYVLYEHTLTQPISMRHMMRYIQWIHCEFWG